MRHLEFPSPINTVDLFLRSKPCPITDGIQLPAQITQRISDARVPANALKTPQFCQYPNAPKTDDYNINEGIGQASLQGAIDALNNFKTNCKNAIKTKMEAIGPEASKDSKLAAGAASLAKEVLEAAKCFTRIVKNVNNLVNSYIAAANNTRIGVISQINLLEDQCNKIKNTCTSRVFL